MKLDKRATEKSSHQPRTTRELGSPVYKLPPPTCKSWMIKTELKKSRDNPADSECVSDENLMEDEHSDSAANEILKLHFESFFQTL